MGKAASHEEQITAEIDHGKKRLLVTHRGTLDKEGAIRSFKVVHNAEGFDPTYDTLTDYRDIQKVEIAFSDLGDILNAAKSIEKRTGLNALVIGDDFGRLTFAKLFCELSTTFSTMKIRYKAFSKLEDAEAWLDRGV